METFENDPQQAAMDAAVAQMAASHPSILTPIKAEGVQPTGPFDAAGMEPSERVRLARGRVAAWNAAIAALRTRGRADVEPISAAIAAADVDGIVTALVSHAVGLLLDSNLGRPDTLLHGLNHGLLAERQAAIWDDAARILASPPEDVAGDLAYVLQEAVAATTPDAHVFNMQGQPAPSKRPPLSSMSTVLAR